MNRMLIIEDDLNTLSGLQELLSQEGYWARGITQGHQAFEILATEPIDMVLCDYRLPDVDGLQVCRALKRLYPYLIIFLITAYRNTEVVNLAKQCGVEKIIDKPIDLEELFDTLAASMATLKNQNRYTPDQKVGASVEEPILV